MAKKQTSWSKFALCLLGIWSLPALSFDQNIPPTVNGLHLGDSYRQVVSILGNGEALPMEPGVFSMFYGDTGLSLILSEQAGISRIEQIDGTLPVSGSIFGVQVGQSRAVIEQMVGQLNSMDTDTVNDAVLVGQGWQVHFVFDDQDILQKFALVANR